MFDDQVFDDAIADSEHEPKSYSVPVHSHLYLQSTMLTNPTADRNGTAA